MSPKETWAWRCTQCGSLIRWRDVVHKEEPWHQQAERLCGPLEVVGLASR